MFERIQVEADDSILGLIEKFRQDANPDKVDLGVGVYRDAQGNTPIMRAVKLAEEQLLRTEMTKTYTDSHGDPEFARNVTDLILGADNTALAAGRVSTTQTPGGSAALRVAADLLALEFPEKTLWLPAPTWPNHRDLFSAAGVKLASYPYLDAAGAPDFTAMAAQLRRIPAGDAVLLHACCHNPSGYDLSAPQWQEVLAIMHQRKLLPLIDFAYQGLGDGLDADAYGVRLLASELDELLVTHSCCKNFGIYAERTGCLLALAADDDAKTRVRGRIAAIARSLYSSPPGHGSAIVKTVFASRELTGIWQEEVDAMRARIKSMREQFVQGMAVHGLERRFAHVRAQRGLFSYTGLSAAQVAYLRREHSVYLISSGRANIAGLTPDNMAHVCQAIAQAVAPDQV